MARKNRLSALLIGIASAVAVLGGLMALSAVHAQNDGVSTEPASPITVTVRPSALHGWSLAVEAAEGAGAFVAGPGQPPRGAGSAQLTANADGRVRLGTTTYAGVRLIRISQLSYSTYRSTFDPDDHTTLNLSFDIDYDAEDTVREAQGRLVFEPYKSMQPYGGVYQNVWQTWDALALTSAWWATAQPGARYCSEDRPCTWQEVLRLFPRAAIAQNDGMLLLRAGSSWRRAVTASADALIVGVSSATTLYDFEPETPCTAACFVDATNGDDAFGGDTPVSAKRTLQAALAQVSPGGVVVVAPGVYREMVVLTKPVTLAGPNQGVCANDPATVVAPSGNRNAEAILAPDGRAALVLAAGVDRVTVDGFTITAPATAGIVAEGSGGAFEQITLRNNHIDLAGGSAIVSANGLHADWQIVCNRIEGVSDVAIELAGAANRGTRIESNFVRGSGVSGQASAIVVEHSADATISDNYISQVGVDAIRLVGSVQRTVVTGNSIVDAGVGVHLLTTAGATPTWLDQVYIEYNAITDLRRSAVLVEQGEDTGVLSEVCLCANTIEQTAGLLANDASLIDLRLRMADAANGASITVRQTSVRINGAEAATVHALRVRGNVYRLAVIDNRFESGTAAGAPADGAPPASGIYLQTDDAEYGVLAADAGITITGNQIGGFENGVSIFDPTLARYGGLPAGLAITASGNGFAGNRQYGVRSGAGELVAAVNNWWGDADGPGGAGPGAGDNVSENVVYCTWLSAPSPASAARGFVRNVNAAREFCTIGAAVAAEITQDGDTLVAAPRVYPEVITVTKSITLSGAGVGASTIRVPSALPAGGASLVTITGDDVMAHVHGFTIEGPAAAPCGALRAGIAVEGGASARIYDNELRDIRNEPLLTCPQGVGITVGNRAAATAGHAEIQNNVIIGYQKAGVVVSSAGSTATIAGNRVEGAGPTSVLVQNGIQVSYGATATVTGNLIRSHSYTPFNLVSTGMLFYQADGDTDGNALYDNQVGIYLVDSSGVHERNLIDVTAGVLASPGVWGIIVDAPPPGRIPLPHAPAWAHSVQRSSASMLARLPAMLAMWSPQTDVRVTSARVTAASFAAQQQAEVAAGVQRVIVRSNELRGDGAAGSVGLQADGGYGALDIDLTATNNVIRGWGRGVNITQCAGVCNPSTLRAVTVRHNMLEDNGAGFDNRSAGGYGVLAVENWWGALSGPTTLRNAGGAGDALQGDAGFAPWLCDGADSDPGIGFQPDSASLCSLAERLVILTQPQGSLEGFPLPQQPVVRVEDRNGILARNFNGPVTIAPVAGVTAQLGGDTTVYAVGGLAQFTNVRVDAPGVGVLLQISAPGLAPVVSAPLDIAPQTGSILVSVEVVGQPPASTWQLIVPNGVITLPATGGELLLADVHANRTYTMALAAKQGYTVQGVCEGGVLAAENRVAVAVSYQVQVTCDFVATAQPATLTVQQQVNGEPPAINWQLTGDLGEFTLPAAGGAAEFRVPAGIYAVQNAERVSYRSAATCSNGAGGSSQIMVKLAPGELVNCTFVAEARKTGLTLHKTAGLVAGECGISDSIGVPAGTTVYYCYAILNTGEAPLAVHNLADSSAGAVLADLDYTVLPGERVDTVALGRVISESVSATLITDGVWTAATRDGPAVHDQAQAAVNVLRAATDAALTVGVAGIGCSTQQSLSVAAGSRVDYCVTLLNSGEVSLNRHQFEIPGLGITMTLDHPLAPGAFVRLTAAEAPALGNVIIDDARQESLRVISTNAPGNRVDPPRFLVAPELFVAEETATATVTVLPDDDEEPAAANLLYLPSVAR